MKTRTYRTFVALAMCHWLGDCFGGGAWPMFKKLAGLDLSRAGLIATVTLLVGAGLQPFFGQLSDGGRQRPLFILGTTLAACGVLLGTATFVRPYMGEDAWYWFLFGIMLTACVGQGMYHPAGTSAAGNLSEGRRSVLVSLFIACGMSGFALSQGLFSFFYRRLDAHTEWLLLPAAAIILYAIWHFHPDPRHLSHGKSLRERLRIVASVRGPLTRLFVIQVMMGAMFHSFIFLMPEFFQERGCPGWMIYGGGYFFWVGGTALLMIPIGHRADVANAKGVLMLCAAAAVILYGVTVLSTPAWWLYIPILLITGGVAGGVNPVCVAMGQHLAPRHASLVSGILMGLAWATASPALWLAGWLAEQEWSGVIGTLLAMGGFGLGAMIMSIVHGLVPDPVESSSA